MGLRFSQRIEKTPIKDVIQIGDIDEDLKNSLWNKIIDIFNLDDNRGYRHNPLSVHVWACFFKQTKDIQPNKGYYDWFRTWFFEQAKWYEIYDFLEYLCSFYRVLITVRSSELYEFIDRQTIDVCDIFNSILEQELAGYRIIDNNIVPITSEVEMEAINNAIMNTDKYKSVNSHLKTAIEYLSDRKSPDYRNCIKESISAVESFCKIISDNDKATLGDALKEIEKKFTLHKALKEAFLKIYGYTSDSGGIRHSLTENDSVVTQEDAIFMLIACSAFINYLKAKSKQICNS